MKDTVKITEKQLLELIQKYKDDFGFSPCLYIRPYCGNSESLYTNMTCGKEIGEPCPYYKPVDFVQMSLPEGTKHIPIEGYARMDLEDKLDD